MQVNQFATVCFWVSLVLGVLAIALAVAAIRLRSFGWRRGWYAVIAVVSMAILADIAGLLGHLNGVMP